jgi:hypothetical protein
MPQTIMTQGLMPEIVVETVVVAGVKRRHEVVADSPHRLLEGIRTSKYVEWITTATKQTIMFLLVWSIAVSYHFSQSIGTMSQGVAFA